MIQLSIDRPSALAGRHVVGLLATLVAIATAVVVLPWLAMQVGFAAQDAAPPDLDPDHAFVYLFAHHGAQLLGALGLIGLFSLAGASRGSLDWGLRLGEWRLGLKVAAVFGLVTLALNFAVDALPFIVSGQAPGIPYWPTPTAMTGVLAFQWLWVGLGEEVLFRGFVLGVLQPLLPSRHRWGRLDISTAGIVTAALFALEHGIFFGRGSPLDITFDPSWIQVAYAFVLGVYYAALRERTRSLLGPIVSHNLSDGTLVLMTYLALAVTGWPIR